MGLSNVHIVSTCSSAALRRLLWFSRKCGAIVLEVIDAFLDTRVYSLHIVHFSGFSIHKVD